jgi:hypothetical protein
LRWDKAYLASVRKHEELLEDVELGRGRRSGSSSDLVSELRS